MKYSRQNKSTPKGTSSKPAQTGSRKIAENPYLDKTSSGSVKKGARPMPQNPYAASPKAKKTSNSDVELSDFMQTSPSARQMKTQNNGQSVGTRRTDKRQASQSGQAGQVGQARTRQVAQQYPQSGGRARKINDNAVRHKQKHKKNYILYYLLMFIIFAATGITLSLTVFFNVGNIAVEFEPGENKNISQGDIIAASGVKLGDNMFRMSTKNIEEKISKKFITVEEVSIKRSFPQTLSIHIVNAQPKALLSFDGNGYVISERNRVMEVAKLDEMEAEGLIRFTGSDIKGIKPGDYLTEDEKYRTIQIDLVIAAVAENEMSDVTSADVSDIMALKLYCGDMYLIKAGGTANLSYKLHCAKSIIERELTDKSIKGMIDVSVDNGMYYFRPTDKLITDDQDDQDDQEASGEVEASQINSASGESVSSGIGSGELKSDSVGSSDSSESTVSSAKVSSEG